MFSERLKEIRTNKNVTQQAIANYLGITIKAYQHYEYNKRKPPFEVIIKLCDYFDVSADYLILGREDISIERLIATKESFKTLKAKLEDDLDTLDKDAIESTKFLLDNLNFATEELNRLAESYGISPDDPTHK